jgi:aryl-alcohol dehydrogenase-like predicted oxidoreductase
LCLPFFTDLIGHDASTSRNICLGAMMFGQQTDEAESGCIMASASASARDAGVNFIDTADAYGASMSEKIVGRAIQGDRDRWVLATKLGYPAGAPFAADLSRKYVMHAVEQSLRGLGTDYIDLYYLHRDDLSTPLEETVRAIADLAHQGKIRYFGVSKFRAWRLAEVVRLCVDARFTHLPCVRSSVCTSFSEIHAGAAWMYSPCRVPPDAWKMGIP